MEVKQNTLMIGRNAIKLLKIKVITKTKAI